MFSGLLETNEFTSEYTVSWISSQLLLSKFAVHIIQRMVSDNVKAENERMLHLHSISKIMPFVMLTIYYITVQINHFL